MFTYREATYGALHKMIKERNIAIQSQPTKEDYIRILEEDDKTRTQLLGTPSSHQNHVKSRLSPGATKTQTVRSSMPPSTKPGNPRREKLIMDGKNEHQTSGEQQPSSEHHATNRYQSGQIDDAHIMMALGTKLQEISFLISQTEAKKAVAEHACGNR
jgi:hypothetical protein